MKHRHHKNFRNLGNMKRCLKFRIANSKVMTRKNQLLLRRTKMNISKYSFRKIHFKKYFRLRHETSINSTEKIKSPLKNFNGLFFIKINFLLIDCSNSRKFQTFQTFQHRSPTGRNITYLIGITELLYESHTVSPSH